ncbi:MAG TPA: Hsp20/alpha crystallin family protein [Solirubrobacterales bacterium]|nr:Hsp20/alpha crystallin family protein [Solirubrobacterales bacterium]
MARQRTMLVNIERMRRDVDDLLGAGWAPARGADFHPRVDVYYSEGGEERGPQAVVVADIAGVATEAVNVEVSGRMLVITGRRPVRRTEGRAYQQVEIPTGSFRRAVELGVDIDAEGARATFEDGLLRIELPIRLPEAGARKVPVERSSG